MIIESPLQLIFRDLFYRLAGFAGSHDVFLKLEGFNITGSIKVKTAIGLVENLEQRGLARPNETVKQGRSFPFRTSEGQITRVRCMELQ
jgi:cysteine synthase A